MISTRLTSSRCAKRPDVLHAGLYPISRLSLSASSGNLRNTLVLWGLAPSAVGRPAHVGPVLSNQWAVQLRCCPRVLRVRTRSDIVAIALRPHCGYDRMVGEQRSANEVSYLQTCTGRTTQTADTSGHSRFRGRESGASRPCARRKARVPVPRELRRTCFPCQGDCR